MSEVKIKTRSGEVKFEVEIARTEEERARGLMWRKELPEERGMLFIDDREEVEYFWMKNTLIELDMIFIGADMRVAHICRKAEPCEESEECPLYSSEVPVRYCLEIGGGLCAKLGIDEGDEAEF